MLEYTGRRVNVFFYSETFVKCDSFFQGNCVKC